MVKKSKHAGMEATKWQWGHQRDATTSGLYYSAQVGQQISMPGPQRDPNQNTNMEASMCPPQEYMGNHVATSIPNMNGSFAQPPAPAFILDCIISLITRLIL